MKILTVGTYPIENPTHGGQHRVTNIVRLLGVAGHEVRTAGVLGHPSYDKSPYFLKYPGDLALKEFLERPALMEDWAIGQLAVHNEGYFRELADRIDWSPDLILVEQPWLFGFAQKFNRSRLRGRARIVYSSHNIESALKYEIAKRWFGSRDAADFRQKVLECELDAIRSADLVFCVSEGDRAWTAQYSKKPPFLAPNGVADGVASFDDIRSANELTHAKPFALYCASAHPPNLDGFFEIFGKGVGSFPPGAKLVVAGGAGQSIKDSPQFHKAGGLSAIYIDAGKVSGGMLRGLLATAHMVLLPITHGGGTNLKSAEAIWSGRYVVGTQSAMRGFEEFVGSRGIVVENDGQGFNRAIRTFFMQPRLDLTMDERDRRRAVLWEETLSSIIREVGAMERVA
ncbi:glycosyltransferase [Sphingobium sp. AN558]|uniref:glycosyltransferase n=1 Tax=Sphingobium sp. AN558 TaxID=3133442 RepID=UPI0030BC94E1